MRMPAITLWQPWAAVVAAGLKPVENRPWPPPASIRGKRIAIHAGKFFDNYSAFESIDPVCLLLDSAIVSLRDHGDRQRQSLLSQRGAVLAVATVAGYFFSHDDRSRVEWFMPAVDDVTGNDSRWWMRDQFGWLLRDVRLLKEPFACRGFQRIWTVDIPDELLPAGGEEA